MSDLGDLVAGYGAIVATLVGVRQWRRDRNPLAITLEPWYPDEDPNRPDDYGPPTFLVRVVNRSPEPITVARFGIGYQVDYRRTRPEVLRNYGSPINVVCSGEFKLGTFDAQTGSVLQDEIRGELYGRGHPPFRIDHVWAEDLAGRRLRGRVAPIYKSIGYDSWDTDAPPLLIGPIKAWWWGMCMAVYRARSLGSRGGPRIVNALHRLRLFPVELAPENEGAY